MVNAVPAHLRPHARPELLWPTSPPCTVFLCLFQGTTVLLAFPQSPGTPSLHLLFPLSGTPFPPPSSINKVLLGHSQALIHLCCSGARVAATDTRGRTKPEVFTIRSFIEHSIYVFIPPILLLRSLLYSSRRTHLHEALWIFMHLLYCLMPLEVSHTEGRNLDSC